MIDNISKSIGNDKCYDCDIELNQDNISRWQSFREEHDKQIAVRVYLLCDEVNNRLLTSCKLEGDTFVPTLTEEEVRKSIKEEGLTFEILKAQEEYRCRENEEVH